MKRWCFGKDDGFSETLTFWGSKFSTLKRRHFWCLWPPKLRCHVRSHGGAQLHVGPKNPKPQNTNSRTALVRFKTKGSQGITVVQRPVYDLQLNWFPVTFIGVYKDVFGQGRPIIQNRPPIFRFHHPKAKQRKVKGCGFTFLWLLVTSARMLKEWNLKGGMDTYKRKVLKSFSLPKPRTIHLWI